MMRAMATRIRRFRRDTRGATAVEFALILPVLIVALAGLIDYGLLVYNNNEMENAARSGAQYAMLGDTQAADDAAITAAAYDALRDTSGVTTTISRSCQCPDGTAVACSGTLCTDDIVPGAYIKVHLHRDYVPLFGLVLDNPTDINAEAILRYE